MSQTLNIATSDKENFVVDVKVASKSLLIKNMIEDMGVLDESLPLYKVNANVFRKVLEWCEHHKDDAEPEVDEDPAMLLRKQTSTEMSEWDTKFMAVDQEMLFEIILAANYMDIKPLLDCGCKTVANMIKGKTPEEIRKTFNITKDFTPEEEAQIKRENEWAEDR